MTETKKEENRKEALVVLQVLSGLQVGGAESRVMDLTRVMNREQVRYAFLLNTKGPDYYEEEAKKLGCEIYRIPRFRFYNYFSYRKAVRKFFLEHPEIAIVQGHMTSTAALYLPIAKKCGVKATIAHARSAGVDKGLKGYLTKWLRRNLPQKTDYMWACSTEAAKAVYGEKNYDKVRVIPNAIDTAKFENCPQLRRSGEEIRKKYGLENALVIGHVGRFHYAKNHEFLLEVFAKICECAPNARLLLVGEGSGMEAAKQQTEKLGIASRVVFAGRQSDVASYYYAMDMLLFPSRYEGLPGTVVEAQAAELPCLVSDSVTKDVAVTKLVTYMSLKHSSKEWADAALLHLQKIREEKKAKTLESPVELLRENGFDVHYQAKKLEEYYIAMAK